MSAPTGPAGPRAARALRPGDFVPPDPAAPLTDRTAVEAYVASVCFKHGPPRLTGTELEWLVRAADHPARPLDPVLLARALGPHAPRTLDVPHDPAPLPAGCTVTVEPGGQVEIASPPLENLSSLVRTVQSDAGTMRGLLATQGLSFSRRASDPLRPPRRILDVPRYATMEAAFDRIGPHGRTMMCSTSAVQVCVDAGEGGADGGEVAHRWAALHELGPVLLAAFANSPVVHGRRTGWKSSRMASWLALDPERTSPPAAVGGDPGLTYARRALDTAVLCVRRDGTWKVPGPLTFGEWIDGALDVRPTRSDLDYHLTTLFPPVRPQGHLEVRYIDQQPGDEWVVPLVVVAALMLDPGTVDRARAAAEPAADRWTAAARHGLADRVLRRAAGDVFSQAQRTLAGPVFADLDPWVRQCVDHAISERVLRGRCPADENLGEPGEPRSTADPDERPGPDDPSAVPRDSCDPEPAPAPRSAFGGDQP